MRRAAPYLTSIALLGFLSSFAMAKAESTQNCRSGMQLVAVNNHLPQPTIVASPRSATQPIQISPTLQRHTFLREFYSDDMKNDQTTSTPPFSGETVAAPVSVAQKHSIWTEQRVRLSLLSGAAKKLAFNFFRR